MLNDTQMYNILYMYDSTVHEHCCNHGINPPAWRRSPLSCGTETERTLRVHSQLQGGRGSGDQVSG